MNNKIEEQINIIETFTDKESKYIETIKIMETNFYNLNTNIVK